jgi:two-component system cell cycle response regulator
VTVLRRDIAEPEPIHDGAGWTTYDAPTRPAGPNPLARNGHGNGQLADRGGRADQQRAEQARADQTRAERPRTDHSRTEQQVADVEPIELVGQVSRVSSAERLSQTERIPQADRLAAMDRLPADRLPVDRLPVDRLPADSVSVDRLPAERMSADRAPADRLPVDRLAAAERMPQLDRLTQPGPIEQLERMQAAEAGLANSSKLIRLHESIAGLLASRGEWRQAYQHLRSALDLVYSDRIEQPPVPEQLRREVDRLRREHAEAREQSIRDSLTASYNRRYLDQRLTSLLADTAGPTARDGLAVALVDLDWFKQVNDTFGHLVGDRVLQRVVELLSDLLPEDAFCARYGGEEFVLVVPGIDAPTAVAVAEAARARVENNAWSQLVPGLRVTVSVGLAHQPAAGPAAGRPPTSAEQQLLRADGLLYAAKQSGRNAVAYRHAGRVLLAGAAADRRRIAEPRAAVTPER